jgi:hypothetical protein
MTSPPRLAGGEATHSRSRRALQHHGYSPEKSIGLCLPTVCDANDVGIVTNDYVHLYLRQPKLEAYVASKAGLAVGGGVIFMRPCIFHS